MAENGIDKNEVVTVLNKILETELAGVVRFWAGEGIRIFRVDNPHTKPFRFWEWLIREVKRDHPETIFLAEAFTRPKVMYQLAKAGLHRVLHVFRLEKHEAGDHPVLPSPAGCAPKSAPRK